MATVDELVNEAMKLDVDQRTVLAHRLLDSLHEEPTEEWSDDWRREIERRVEEAVTGRAKTYTLDEVLEHIRSRRKRA